MNKYTRNIIVLIGRSIKFIVMSNIYAWPDDRWPFYMLLFQLRYTHLNICDLRSGVWTQVCVYVCIQTYSADVLRKELSRMFTSVHRATLPRLAACVFWSSFLYYQLWLELCGLFIPSRPYQKSYAIRIRMIFVLTAFVQYHRLIV